VEAKRRCKTADSTARDDDLHDATADTERCACIA
jgi:hypothetical protein